MDIIREIVPAKNMVQFCIASAFTAVCFVWALTWLYIQEHKGAK